MKLLDKYLFNQVLYSFLFGLALVTIVWIAPELLPGIVSDVVSKKYTLFQGILIILYELPDVLVKSLPMGMLIGSLLVFDRLSKDSEITAMRACGIGVYRMLSSILILGLVGTIISFAVNETLVPATNLDQEKIVNKGKLTTNHFTFVEKTKNDYLNQVILVDKFDGRLVKNIRILNFQPGHISEAGLKEIYAASQAVWKDNQWELYRGIYFQISPYGVYEKNIVFHKMSVATSPKAIKLLHKSLKKPKSMNLFEIKEYVSLLKSSDQLDESRYYDVRFHQKFSQPFAVIVMAVLGVILGIHPPRSSRFIGYSVGMFVILLYYFVWPVSMALGNIGALHPFIAAWLPNFLTICIGVITLKYKDF